MKLGVSLKIDVAKVDKDKLVQGKKGKYLNCTVFIDPNNPDQFGNAGAIYEEVSKEERAAGTKGTILGNAKVFWQGEGKQQAAPQAPAAPAQPSLDDIPF